MITAVSVRISLAVKVRVTSSPTLDSVELALLEIIEIGARPAGVSSIKSSVLLWLPSVLFPGRSVMVALIKIVSPSVKPVSPSTKSPDTVITLSVFRSLAVIAASEPRFS